MPAAERFGESAHGTSRKRFGAYLAGSAAARSTGTSTAAGRGAPPRAGGLSQPPADMFAAGDRRSDLGPRPLAGVKH